MAKLLQRIFSVTNDRYNKVIYLLGIKFAWAVRDKAPYLRFNADIGEVDYEIVHILHSTVFSVKLVEFLNSFVDRKKHLFIFKSSSTLYNSVIEAENIIEGSLNTLKIDLRKTKKIIYHSLLFESDINFLYNNPQLLKITYWSIWGGDLYNRSNKHKYNFVKSNVKAILTVFDEPEYIRQFGEGKKVFNIIYPSDNLAEIKLKDTKSKDDCINIMVNHCADISTIDILKKLEKYKDENIKITTIISYGTIHAKQSKKDIIELGRQIFKDKFYAQTDWMNEDDYNSLLNEQDIIILGMKRQQGLANLRYCAIRGAKMFLSEDNAIYSQLEGIGLHVHKYQSIDELSFEDFIHNDNQQKAQNREIFLKRADSEYIKSLWSRVFYD